MSHIHINSPTPTNKFWHSGTCPDCKQRTRFIEFSYEWYGSSKTCLKCGRRFNDGEWESLDFYRYARRDNIVNAKKRWREAKVLDTIQNP